MISLRFGAAAALLVVGGLLAAPLSPATADTSLLPTTLAAPARATPPADDPAAQPVLMTDVDPADFAAEASALPPELDAALERDAGLSGAEWLAQAEASAVGIEVVDALRDRIDVNAARLEGFELVVTVGSAADAAIVESVGARAELGPATDRVGDSIDGLAPATDLRGGMPYSFNSGTRRCSIGFVGLDTNTLQPQILSAGHCEGDGLLRLAMSITRPTVSGGVAGGPQQLIGDAAFHVTDDYPNPGYPTEVTYYDFGLTPVTGPNWTPKPEVVTWGGGSTGAPLSSAPLVIRDAGPALAGATLCKSGATTGWTCGAITAVDAKSYVGPPPRTCPAASPNYCVGSIAASICVRQGDSGGAAVVGSRAVGIVSAATNGEAVTTCAVNDNFGVFTTLYSVDPALEQVTKVYPNWEPLVGFTSQLTNALPRIDPSVTMLPAQVVGGSSRHGISASIDGGAPQAATVAANGSWGVPIGSLLGTHTWQATASWGSQTQVAPSAGAFLRASATRLSGASRYETAIEIAQYGFTCGGTYAMPANCTDGTVPVVYIAGGAGFADALSAGPAARAEGGPLLLTESTTLPAAVRAELVRLNPDEIVVVGGTGVVSASVKTALAAYAPTVTRVSGASRYETSRLIAVRVLENGGFTTGQSLWVATGTGYADALSAGAAAADAGVPILLVDGGRSTIPTETRAFIDDALQPTDVYIAGGEGVVSAGVASAIDAIPGVHVQRFGGAGRFDTSRLINAFAHLGSAPEVFITYGYNFPDALAGGVLAGLRGGPLYISDTLCVDAQIVNEILDLGPAKVTVLGGTALLSNNARDLKRC